MAECSSRTVVSDFGGCWLNATATPNRTKQEIAVVVLSLFLNGEAGEYLNNGVILW